jgi:hypothetical protein
VRQWLAERSDLQTAAFETTIAYADRHAAQIERRAFDLFDCVFDVLGR